MDNLPGPGVWLIPKRGSVTLYLPLSFWLCHTRSPALFPFFLVSPPHTISISLTRTLYLSLSCALPLHASHSLWMLWWSGGPLLNKFSKVGSPLKWLRKMCLELTFEKVLPARDTAHTHTNTHTRTHTHTTMCRIGTDTSWNNATQRNTNCNTHYNTLQ